MKVKQLMALLMVGVLGMNASLTFAETRATTESTDWYCKAFTPANRTLYAEGYYYRSNSFQGATVWAGSGETVIVKAQTLVASADPDEGNRCPAQVNQAVAENEAVINETYFPDVVAGEYQATGVTFTHYYQMSGGTERIEVYSRTVY